MQKTELDCESYVFLFKVICDLKKNSISSSVISHAIQKHFSYDYKLTMV
jgi:hypothetical protein